MLFKKYEDNPIFTPDYRLEGERCSTHNPAAVITDARVNIIYRAEGDYENYIANLCLATSADGVHFERYGDNPVLTPTLPEEARGCEDPRITRIGDIYYLTYTAFTRYDERRRKYIYDLALATSEDLVNWKKRGVILRRIKAGTIYPEKVDGGYLMIVGSVAMRIARSKDLLHWELEADPFLTPREGRFDDTLVESGPNPLILGDRVFLVYNGADRYWRYSPGYVVLDRNNPRKILARSEEPLLQATEQFELYGKLNNVVFATALVRFKGKYLLYYNGGERCIGLATAGPNDLERFVMAL